MENKILVVIGGGASGFFTAINAYHPNLKVIILEKTSKLLSKVKISGGGRCNVTNSCNDLLELSKHYPRGAQFLKRAFYSFNNQDTIQWFLKNGVRLVAESDGRMFPQSNDSQTIVDVLLQKSVQQNVEIRTRVAVQEIVRKEGLFYLNLDNNDTLICDYLCIASGGGSKIEHYDWLSFSGAKIVDPVPSLFTFNMPKHPITALMGLSMPDVQVKINGTKIQTNGPLLITHWGLSGPAILKASAWGASILAQKQWQFQIQVNWLPAYNEDSMIDFLKAQTFELATRNIENKNPFQIPQRLWNYFLETAGINISLKWASLASKERNKLAKLLTNTMYDIHGKTTFKEEFVTAGGIDLKEIDANTMMSKKIPNLFFVGEVLNIDGITGGFNFQSAWTTAWIASQAILKNF